MAQPIPKPGDKVLIVTGRSSFIGRTFPVVRCPDWSNRNDKIWVELNGCHIDHVATLPPNYEIVSETSEQYANPGDTIEITYNAACGSNFVGKKFKVIERPGTKLSTETPGSAWIVGPAGPCFFRPEHYILIESSSDKKENVDAFLKKQMDDNLRGMFV